MKIIYAYTDIHYPGWIKVGETTRSPEERIKEQYMTILPCPPIPYKIIFQTNGISNSNQPFSDHQVHDILCAMGIKRGFGEWFFCKLEDIKQAIEYVKKDQSAIDIYKKYHGGSICLQNLP